MSAELTLFFQNKHKMSYLAAEKVKKQNSKTNDELLSNQMLVGIPEVDLGCFVYLKA